MTLIDRSLLCALAVWASATFSFTTAAGAADDAAKPAAPADSAKADSPKTEEAGKSDPAKADAAKTDRSLREQQIYIPYEKLRSVFEKHGRGVFLPYEKFEELWKAAQDKTRPAAEALPPVGAVITEVENEAAVGKDVVQVTAHVKIDLLTEGWHEVPLRLADAALMRATIKGEPARVLGGANEEHHLLVEKKGKQPEQIELVLEYARAIARSPGQNSVSFQAPQAAVSRWKVRIPQAGVKVNLHPLIAATEVPPAAAAAKPDDKKPAEEKKADETVILAFVGAAPTVQIDWTPKSEGATGLTYLASVQAEQQLWIQEGITRTRTTLAYAISRAELKEISFEIPAEFKVVNVFDPNVRQWSVEPPAAGATVQTVKAQLFEPAKDKQSVVVELEKIAGQKRVESLKVPVVKALNVGRQQGFVVVQVGSGLRAEASKTSGLSQVDANELPVAMRSVAWTFAYRYASVPFELELAVEEVSPRITVDSLVEARLEPEKLTLDLTVFYTIERAGVFKLELDVPEGFELRSVTGRQGAATAAPGMPPTVCATAEVDSHHLEGKKNTHLVVNLARKALGRVGLHVQLQREMPDAKLLTPTEKPIAIDLPLPQPTKATVEHSSGRLVISAPESLRVNPAEVKGLRAVSFQEAMEGIAIPAPPPPGSSAPRPVLAFMFTQEPVTLGLAVERRKPQVTVRQLLVARIEEGVIKYEATFFYSIHYSGVKSLRIDVPADVSRELHNKTPGIHEKIMDPPPPGVEKNMVAWSLVGEGELLGDVQINLVWDQKLDKLDVGKDMEVVVPHVAPREVDLAWGQIALAKAETLNFQEGENLKGLRPIDPQRELTPPVSGAARAFEFLDEWTLPLTITRYELAQVKPTSIDRAVCRMVVTPAGEIAVQAVYRIRSVKKQLNVQLPAETKPEFDPFCINGRPIDLQKGQGDALVVPLGTTKADEPFILEIRYTLTGGNAFSLPTFLDDAAVQKVYLCVFVPAAQDVLGTSGSWTEDFQWDWGKQHRWIPVSPDPRETHERLVDWVCDGNNGAAGAAKTFHFDGTPLVFSTLRPDPQTNVRLWTLDHQALDAWIFGIVLLGGVLLVRTSAAQRVLASAMLVVVLVFLGVFWPTLSLHVLGCPLFAAVAIVLLFWGIVGMFRLRQPLGTFCTGLSAAWSSRVASRKAAIEKAAPPPEASQDPPSAQDGGASHD